MYLLSYTELLLILQCRIRPKKERLDKMSSESASIEETQALHSLQSSWSWLHLLSCHSPTQKHQTYQPILSSLSIQPIQQIQLNTKNGNLNTIRITKKLNGSMEETSGHDSDPFLTQPLSLWQRGLLALSSIAKPKGKFIYRKLKNDQHNTSLLTKYKSLFIAIRSEFI